MLDIIFIAAISLGFASLKFFSDWCGKQVNKKQQ